MTRTARSLSTPLGPVTLVAEGDALVALDWRAGAADDTPLLAEAARQLTAYFDGRLIRFDLPWRIAGSPAQQAVCTAIAAIPHGDTRRYGDLARDLKLSAQAVGQLCGGNPLPLIIPCHRVLGGRSLGGFSAPGGIESKVWLLRHEGAANLLI